MPTEIVKAFEKWEEETMWINQMRRTAATCAIALFLTAAYASAQTVKEPWQGTFTKTQHLVGATSISIDLPLPPVGKILTLERVSVSVGPMASAYGRVRYCHVESGVPRLTDHEWVENKTRLLLPLPEQVVGVTRTVAIPSAAARLYVGVTPPPFVRGHFRVICESEFIAANDPMTVTAVGYLTPSNQ